MKQRVSPAELRRAIGGWAWFSATAGGLGHMWPASGTWGSLPPVLLFGGLAWWGAAVWAHVLAQLALCAAASAGCLRHGGKVEAALGRKDPGAVVIDEVAGMALTLALTLLGVVALEGMRASAGASAALGRVPPASLGLALAMGSFVWFRVMDVIKPPPARGLQRLSGGMGVLVDDLVVAPYAAVATLVSLEFMVRMGPVGA